MLPPLLVFLATSAPPPSASARPPVEERSAYFELGRAEAVRWRPFGAAAFREAEEKGLPVLLDLGAMWCHSCRTMSELTYRDAGVAAGIEGRFLPIKADRDQFPHLDARLQAGMLRMRGIGGWPLTVFLTEQGRLFSGGTFFMPEEGPDGKPGLKRALDRYGEDYQAQKRGYHNTAEQLAAEMQEKNLTGDQPGPLEGVAEAVAEAVFQATDFEAGGFGTGAKFPEPAAVGFALEWGAERDPRLTRAARVTLDAMANGAVRDRLAGGFHRATLDRGWREPRFEKLLAVNAGQLLLYTDAYRLTGVERYRKVAGETLDYLLRVLADRKHGGFFAAQAPDRGPGDDGSTYTWTRAELRRELKPDALQVFSTYYGLATDPSAAPGEDQRQALAATRPIDRAAAAAGITVEKATALLEGALESLRKVRLARPDPPIDHTMYAALNGLAAEACLRAAVVLGREDARTQALLTLDLFLARGFDEKTGFVRGIRDGESFGDGILADQAYLAGALLEAYQASGKSAYLDAARRTLDLARQRFGGRGSGGLQDVPIAGPDYSMFVIPIYPVEDRGAPGENPRIILAEARLARLTGDEARAERARGMARSFAGSAGKYGLYGASLALAVKQLLEPPPVVVAVGAAAGSLAAAARASKRSGVLVVRAATAADLPPAWRIATIESALAQAAPGSALVVVGSEVRGSAADPVALEALLEPPSPPAKARTPEEKP